MEVETERDAVDEPDRAGGPIRRGFRSTLIYFGLARPVGEEPDPPRSPVRRLGEHVLVAALWMGFVGGHRGTTVGWLYGLLFVPGLVLLLTEVAGRRTPDEAGGADMVTVTGLLFGVVVLIVPKHDSLWVAIAITAGIAAIAVALGTARMASLSRDSAR